MFQQRISFFLLPTDDTKNTNLFSLSPDSPMDNTETGQADDEKEKNYDEVVEAIDSILANGTSEFYENYPVDESFFLWLESHYGAGTVDSIATSLREKNADLDLWYQMTGCTMHVLWLEFCKEYQYQTYRLLMYCGNYAVLPVPLQNTMAAFFLLQSTPL